MAHHSTKQTRARYVTEGDFHVCSAPSSLFSSHDEKTACKIHLRCFCKDDQTEPSTSRPRAFHRSYIVCFARLRQAFELRIIVHQVLCSLLTCSHKYSSRSIDHGSHRWIHRPTWACQRMEGSHHQRFRSSLQVSHVYVLAFIASKLLQWIEAKWIPQNLIPLLSLSSNFL